MNKLQKAYKTLQDASGIEVGDRVRIIAAPAEKLLNLIHDKDNAYGHEYFKDKIGEVTKVESISNGAIHLGYRYNIPFFCLELIEKGTKPLMFADKEVKIDGSTLTVGCTSGTFSEIEAIYKAMLEEQS